MAEAYYENVEPETLEQYWLCSFPNIDNREALEKAGLDITEDELKVSNLQKLNK